MPAAYEQMAEVGGSRRMMAASSFTHPLDMSHPGALEHGHKAPSRGFRNDSLDEQRNVVARRPVLPPEWGLQNVEAQVANLVHAGSVQAERAMQSAAVTWQNLRLHLENAV